METTIRVSFFLWGKMYRKENNRGPLFELLIIVSILMKSTWLSSTVSSAVNTSG